MEINEVNQDSYLSSVFEPELFTWDSYSNDNYYGSLYRDDLIKTIIDKYPNDAYNIGFTIESDSSEDYTDILNGFKTYEMFRRASKFARLYGLCCLFIMVEGDTKLDEPIRPTSRPVGLKLYRLYNYQDIDLEKIPIGSSLIHRSRLLFFTGKEVFIEVSQEVKMGYTSIIEGFIDEYNNYKPMSKTFNKLINTSNQVILGTKGLSAKLRADILNGTDLAKRELLERARAVNSGRSLHDIVVHDLENEAIGNVSLTLAGANEAFEKLEHLLAIRTGYPYHVIFGESVSSTLGSGTNAQLIYRMMYADRVTQWIDNNWTENIETLCNQLKIVYGLADFTISIPLGYVLSDDERATICETWSKTLSEILKSYPMDYDQIMLFINDNFPGITVEEIDDDFDAPMPSVTLPGGVEEIEPTEAVNADATLTTVIENASIITQADIDKTMEDIAKQSQT